MAAGKVLVDGTVATRAAMVVDELRPIEIVAGDDRYVSRAGLKLSGALDAMGLDPAGLRCLDAGASTGGFTDCLLQRGALRVLAVDVGSGQLHPRLRTDGRVDSREQTDIRTLHLASIGGPVDLAVADLSFISLRLVLPALDALVIAGGPVVVLVKPQFEAGRVDAARGRGVIRDPAVWRRVLAEVTASARALGMGLQGASVSGIRGAGGNVEFVMWLSAAGTGRERKRATVNPGAPHETTLLDRLVAEAEAGLQ